MSVILLACIWSCSLDLHINLVIPTSSTGAKHVFVINHVCRAAPDTTNETKPDGENPTANGSSANAHADFCINDDYMSTMRELSSAQLCPDDRDMLLSARR